MIIMITSKKLANEKGLTLVEILAAMVIISIIFISIITILNLTAKSNRTSKEIIDATYIAQEEMEYIYKISREDSSFESLEQYEADVEDDGWKVYWKETETDDFKIEVREKTTEDSMVRIVVRVYEQADEEKVNPRAQMETLLKWGDDHVENSP